MLRKFAVGLAALGALNAAQVKALGLGEVTVHSALNQPLNAEIDLLQIRDLAASQIVTGLADSDEFYLAGVKPTPVLSDIRFELDIQENGGKILLSTREPIREPFLNFLVEVNWPSGRLVREYTVLLDPPVFTAKDLAPRSAPPAMPLTQGAPVAPRPAAPLAAPVSAPAVPADSYRVGNDDTLWSIAIKTRPDSRVSPQQMMLAIQRANPGAFIGNNINRLKSGSVLRIPTGAEVASLGGDDPVREVNRQNVAWRSANGQGAAPQGGQLDGAAAPEIEGAAPGESEDSRLRIVSKPAQVQDDSQAAQGTLVADETQSQEPAVDPLREELLNKNLELEEQLVVTLEGLDKVERDNAELFQRLDQLGNQMASLQRLLELKDQQLAELQVSLSQAQARAEAAPAPVVPQDDGLMGTLMKYPASLAGGLAALLALVGGGLLFARKRKQKEEQAVDAAMAELDARDGEGVADLKAAGVAGAAAAAAVAAAQSDESGVRDEVAAEEDADDPFNLASDSAGDEFDTLTSEDLDASLGNDLDMDLKIDEPIEEDPEMAEFADSLLSDDDYDLGVEETAAEAGVQEVPEEAVAATPEEGLLDNAEEESDDLDFLLADHDSSAAVETAEPTGEEDDDLDFILGGSEASQTVAEEPKQPEQVSEEDEFESLDDLDALLAMNSPAAEEAAEEATEEAGLEDEAVAAPEAAVAAQNADEPVAGEDFDLQGFDEEAAGLRLSDEESADLQVADEEPELLSELDELLDADAADVEAEAVNEESAVPADEEEAEALGVFMESPQAEAREIAAEETGEPAIAPLVEEDRDDIDRMLAEAGVEAAAPETASAPEEEAAEVAEDDTDLDSLFASFGIEEAGEGPESTQTEESTESGAFDGFSLELEEDEAPVADVVTEEVEEAQEPVAQTTEAAPAVEEELDLADEDDLESELNLMLEDGGNDLSLEETALGEADSETDYLEGADEVGTKLDLARAYIDMDDNDGARDILDEVLKEGSPSQQEEAKELMATLKQ